MFFIFLPHFSSWSQQICQPQTKSIKPRATGVHLHVKIFPFSEDLPSRYVADITARSHFCSDAASLTRVLILDPLCKHYSAWWVSTPSCRGLQVILAVADLPNGAVKNRTYEVSLAQVRSAPEALVTSNHRQETCWSISVKPPRNLPPLQPPCFTFIYKKFGFVGMIAWLLLE